MPHSLQVWAIPPGKTNREVIAVFYDEAKLAEQKKTELEKEGYKEGSHFNVVLQSREEVTESEVVKL